MRIAWLAGDAQRLHVTALRSAVSAAAASHTLRRHHAEQMGRAAAITYGD